VHGGGVERAECGERRQRGGRLGHARERARGVSRIQVAGRMRQARTGAHAGSARSTSGVAGSRFTPALFSARTRKVERLLQRLVPVRHRKLKARSV
jgi:hypothetical protein